MRWSTRFNSILIFVVAAGLVVPAAFAQLPAEAVDLGKVKVPELLKSQDLCPVHLVPSIADGETWTYHGFDYRGSEKGSKAAFLEDPASYASAHERQRWINNFMTVMSSIWCPITDEVTPGGRKQVEGLGYSWESCCAFCDDEMHPDNFEEALDRLAERAALAYDLTGGLYFNDAKSPVEGAILDDY